MITFFENTFKWLNRTKKSKLSAHEALPTSSIHTSMSC